MAEAAQTRVQEAVNKLVEDLDKSNLRKMQGDMHRCAAACCDKQDVSMEVVHGCIEGCSTKVASVQTFIQNELNNFQDALAQHTERLQRITNDVIQECFKLLTERLQRCVMQCQDKVRDQILPSTTESQVKAYQDDYERCVIQCADVHIDLMPGLLRRMNETISGKI